METDELIIYLNGEIIAHASKSLALMELFREQAHGTNQKHLVSRSEKLENDVRHTIEHANVRLTHEDASNVQIKGIMRNLKNAARVLSMLIKSDPFDQSKEWEEYLYFIEKYFGLALIYTK